MVRAVFAGLLLIACSAGTTRNTCDLPTRPSEYDQDGPPPSCASDAGDAGPCEPICQMVCPPPNVANTYLGSCVVTTPDGGDAGAGVTRCHYLPYPLDPVCR